MNKKTFALVGLGVVALLFFGVNLFGGTIFKRVRLDLTEARLFTISDGTRNILAGMEEPVTLRLYYSRKVAAKKAAGLLGYAQRVLELLEEYRKQSDGKLELLVIDPDRFSEEEEEAISYGLRPTPVSQAGDQVFFGVAGTNDVGDQAVIPLFVPSRENFLEYDLTKLIYDLTHVEKHKVGVLSALPIAGAPPSPFNPQSRGTDPWYFLSKLKQTFEVETIERSATELPQDIDILVLVHPKELNDDILFDIDQFALGGGKVIAFLDPHCEFDTEGINPQDRMSAFSANRTSDLGPLLAAWGFELVPEKLAADRANGRMVPVAPGEQVPYVILPELPPSNVSAEDPIARDLKRVTLLAGGILRRTAESTTQFDRLLWTSEDSMELERYQIAMGADPAAFLTSFQPGDEELTVGARIHGPVKTAYPDGAPEKPAVEGEPPPPVRIPPEGGWKTEGDIHVVAIADADMLYHELWADIARLGNVQLEVGTRANNYDLLVNAIDNLMGDEDLISLRSRPGFTRPFTRVEKMLEEASVRFQEEKEELEKKLADAQRRIDELQSQKEGGVAQMIVSPEQRAEIEKYRKEKRETNRKLRDVNHSLMKDIEGLGSRVKLLNIVALPLAIAILAAVLGIYRIHRKRS